MVRRYGVFELYWLIVSGRVFTGQMGVERLGVGHMPSSPYKTDAGLLGRVRDKRDDASWRDFVEIYDPLLYRYARLRGQDHEDAKEIVQECMTILVQKMPDYEYSPANGKFKSWLRTMANNKIRDRFKRRRPAVAPVEEFGHMEENHQSADELWEEQWQRKHVRFWLKKILGKVAPTTRQAFELHVVSGWAVEDVAKTLNLSTDQVYAAKSRITQQLKRKVKSFLGEGGCTKL